MVRKAKAQPKPGGAKGAPVSARLKRKRVDGKPFNPSHPRLLKAKLKEVEALRLRLQGLSFDEIGKRMGIPEGSAHSIIMRLLSRYEGELAQNIPQARREEIERCRTLIGYLKIKCKKGDTKAIQTTMKLSERISRLQGLDAPIQLKHGGEGENGTISIEVFRKTLREEMDGTGPGDQPPAQPEQLAPPVPSV